MNDAAARPADPDPRTWRIAGWLLREGRFAGGMEALLAGFCERLAAADAAIDRVTLHFRTLHPQVRGRRVLWRRGAAEIEDTLYHRRDESVQAMYLQSPLYAVYATGRPLRRRLEGMTGEAEFPILADLKAEGMTDYYAAPLTFGNGDRHVIGFASRRAGGFQTGDLAVIEGVIPALTPVVEAVELRRTTETLLKT